MKHNADPNLSILTNLSSQRLCMKLRIDAFLTNLINLSSQRLCMKLQIDIFLQFDKFELSKALYEAPNSYFLTNLTNFEPQYASYEAFESHLIDLRFLCSEPYV